MATITLSGHDPTTGKRVDNPHPEFFGQLNEKPKGKPEPAIADEPAKDPE